MMLNAYYVPSITVNTGAVKGNEIHSVSHQSHNYVHPMSSQAGGSPVAVTAARERDGARDLLGLLKASNSPGTSRAAFGAALWPGGEGGQRGYTLPPLPAISACLSLAPSGALGGRRIPTCHSLQHRLPRALRKQRSTLGCWPESARPPRLYRSPGHPLIIEALCAAHTQVDLLGGSLSLSLWGPLLLMS